MTTTESIPLIIAASTLIGGVLGFFIKYFLDKRQQFITKNAEFKRGAYSDLITLILDVMSQSKAGKISQQQLIKRLNQAYQQCILYASTEVIIAFGDFMQYILRGNENPKQTMIYVTTVFKYMRTDIGLKNNNLGENAEKLMRVKLSDYGDFFEDKIQ